MSMNNVFNSHVYYYSHASVLDWKMTKTKVKDNIGSMNNHYFDLCAELKVHQLEKCL